ncbi:MAG: SLC13 family permease [Sphaerochaetaceae bacterium]|nr:SLC13 family permease [Sphaerochaetaceae bacterium]
MNTMVICLIICLLAIISYVWGKVSMATTAMVSLVAFVITGCLSPNDALLNFGNKNGIMIMSMFVVAAGLQRTQFIKMVASSVNKIAKGSLVRVMTGYILISIILAQFIQSPLIVFSIMAPMMAATCKDMNIPTSQVMFALGISAITTCSALPLGSGATVAAELNGYLEANGYAEFVVALTDPMRARLPIVILMAVYCIFFASKISPSEPVVATATLTSARKLDKKPPLKPFQERAGYIIFILVTLGLIFQKSLPSALVAPPWIICLTGAVFMVLTGVLSGKEACGAMNIPMYLLFVGAMAMGGALSSSGAGTVIGDAIASIANSLNNKYLIVALFFVVPFLLTQVMQNRAVMMIFIPIAIQACKSMGANPIGVIIIVQTACLAAFMTPMSTVAVPMIMAEGGYDIKSMFKQSILPAALIAIVAILWTPNAFPLY